MGAFYATLRKSIPTCRPGLILVRDDRSRYSVIVWLSIIDTYYVLQREVVVKFGIWTVGSMVQHRLLIQCPRVGSRSRSRSVGKIRFYRHTVTRSILFLLWAGCCEGQITTVLVLL